MLKIRFADNRQPPFWAMEKSFSIGRTSANHLSIDDASVSELHAKILNRGDTFVIKDMGSLQGTYVNGKRITQKNIGCGDTIQIGGVRLEVIDPFAHIANQSEWSLIADSSWLSGQEFPLNFLKHEGRVVVGRSTQCDVTIPGTHLSRQHAELRLEDDKISVTDLKSANGTFINDRKITTANLKPGDRIRFDVYSFKLFGPGIHLPKAATQTMPAITDEMLAQESGEEKLWKTRSTSPGNREQIDLYKRNWKPVIAAATAMGLLLVFAAGIVYLFF